MTYPIGLEEARADAARRLFDAALDYGAAHAAWLAVLMRRRVPMAEHARAKETVDAALLALHAAYAAYAGDGGARTQEGGEHGGA